MNKPRPAAPAATGTHLTSAQFIPIAVNGYKPNARTTNIAMSNSSAKAMTLIRGSNESLTEHPVNMALQRAKLLRGGEHKYSLWNLLFTFFLLCRTVMSHNWWLILGVIFFAWPVQWLIRWLSKDDPINISTYFEAIKEPLVLEPTE